MATDHAFEDWLLKVDAHVWILTEGQLTIDDIEDYHYRDDYDAGFKPKKTAKRTLAAANYNPEVRYYA